MKLFAGAVLLSFLVTGFAFAGPESFVDGVAIGIPELPTAPVCTVVKTVASPVSNYSTGLAWDGEYLWVSDAFTGELYRFDFDNQVVVDNCNGLDFSIRDLTWQALDGGGGYLWAGTWSQTGRVNKIDVASCQIVGGYNIPQMGGNHCHGAAWNYYNDGSEWRYELILGEEDGDIYWIDPSTGVIDNTCTPYFSGGYDPRGLAWDGFGVWAGYQNDGQLRYYDTNCTLLGMCASTTLYQQGTAWDGHFLYTTGSNQSIARVDVGYPLTVNIVQQGITVAAGSQATFQVEVMNHTPDPISMDAWLDAYLWNGNYFGGNPLLSYSLTFPGNFTVTRTVVVKVPNAAPPADYLVAANVAADNGYPDPTHIDHLRVTVTPPLDGVSVPDGTPAEDLGDAPFTLELQ
jgi:hypothetical protein